MNTLKISISTDTRNILLGRSPRCLAFALLTTAGCSGTMDYAGDNYTASDEEAVDDNEQALVGSTLFPDTSCTEAQKTGIREGHTLGRFASRSAAFQECLAGVTTGTMTRFKTQYHDDVNNVPVTTFGPYLFCENDPLPTATAEQRAARLMSVSGSALDTDNVCGGDCGSKDAIACAADQQAGANERIRWITVKSARDKVAATVWHEVGHNHGYEHDGCSYATDTVRPKDHSGSNLLGGCIQEVILQSAASPVCAATVCGTNEKAMIKRYGKFGSADGCECVPDVFPGEDEANDRYGEAQVAADFDKDTYEDLAVGAPGEGGNIGAVYLFKGSPKGLRFSQRISQATLSVTDYAVSPPAKFSPASTTGDEFGFALAAGDLNQDGFPDLVVGSPGNRANAGGVYIIPGSSTGPKAGKAQWVDQDDAQNAVESGDRFGAALAVGNFDAAGPLDLAVGAPFETYDGDKSGVVNTFLGRSVSTGSGSFLANGGLLHQELGSWVNQSGDEFGAALAVGNFDSDAFVELVVGAPGENASAGFAFIADRTSSAWSMPAALSRSGSSRFGHAIATGDFISTTGVDVAIGAPATSTSTGSVYLFSGAGTTGPSFTHRQTISANETQDELGFSLAVGHVTGDTKADLVVGSPGETFDTGPKEGILRVYTGSTATSLTAAGSFSQDAFYTIGASDTILPPEARGTDRFGHSVVLGRFAGASGTRTAAIGAPKDNVNGANAGAVFVSASGVSQDGRKIGQETMTYGDGWRAN